MVRLTLIVLLGVAGCAASVPRDQVERANNAYSAIAASSEAVFTDLSIAERRLFARTLSSTGAPHDGEIVVPATFDPAMAPYFSTIGDPVLTASLRRGLGLVGDYISLLVTLAAGKNLEEAKTQIDALANSVAGIVTIATGGVALPLAAAAKELEPLIDQWAQARNAEELRGLVLQGEPVAKAEITALRNASSTIYETLTREPMRAVRTTLADNPEARHAEFVKMAEARVAVSNYVVLLDKLNDILLALADAVREPASPVRLGSLSAAADNALVQARAATGAIAAIKAGEAP